MALRERTPRTKKAPSDFGAVGKRGRRTGVELKDTGVRDEDGMEPLPSFSSPVKLASPPHRLAHESTYTADDTMDIGQSTIAEPEEVVRSVKYARTSLPPRSASPRKTGVRGIPRRSIPRPVGAMSSPSANINKGTPSRPVSHPPVNRQLDFSLENSRHHSPRNLPSSGLKASKQASITGKGKKRTFDVSVRGDYNESLDDMNGANGIDSVDEDGQLPNGGDESLGNLRQDHVEISIEEEDPPLVNEESEMFGSEAPSKAEPTNGGRRQPRPQAVVQKDDSQVSLSGPDPPRRGRPGRPPKQPRTDVFRDDNVGTSMPPPKGKRKPAEKDPNDRTRAPLKTTTKPSVSRSGSAGSRAGNVVKRSETPAADSVLTTRSGRHSYKPLASWRGEHLVMGQRDDLDSLPEITAVVRTDEILDAPKKKYGYRKARPRARSQLPDVQEEDEELAPWEADTGIMHGQVMPWDRDTERYDEDNTEEAELAYAAEAIEMRDISGAEFKMAKTLSLKFFGSGMVDLGPGVMKRVKNSRKMQMVFFVHYGRVTVEVGTPSTSFSIGKGGTWQVPRGNFYSIANESETNSARIFFAQGCEHWEDYDSEPVS